MDSPSAFRTADSANCRGFDRNLGQFAQAECNHLRCCRFAPTEILAGARSALLCSIVQSPCRQAGASCAGQDPALGSLVGGNFSPILNIDRPAS